MTARPMRVASLDGLRGGAALVVVVHHGMLTGAQFALPYFGQGQSSHIASMLTYTPLHLFWAGTEAVYLFFVLSGLVLARSMASRSIPWENYFVSRMVRLYLPVIAAALFAWVTFRLSPRTTTGLSMWLDSPPHAYGFRTFAADATLLNGVSGGISPLWSLQWEVLFSLLLPVALVASARVSPYLLLVASIVLSGVGAYLQNTLLTLMPMFMVGVAMHGMSSQLERVRSAIDRRGWVLQLVVGVPVLGIIFMMVTAKWWPLTGVSSVFVASGLQAVSLAGVTAVVAAAIVWRPLVALLATPAFRWLGMISFSVYLVHEPIIKAVAFAFPGNHVATVVAVCGSVLAGWVFYLVCERPIHHLARRLKGARLATAPVTVPPTDDAATAEAQAR